MKRFLAVAMMLALAGSAMAGTTVLDGTGAYFGQAPKLVFHPAKVLAVQTSFAAADPPVTDFASFFAITGDPGKGYDVVNTTGRSIVAITNNGLAQNDDILLIDSSEDYTITMSYTVTTEMHTTAAGGSARAQVALYAGVNTNWGPRNVGTGNGVDLSTATFGGAETESSQTGLEFSWVTAPEKFVLQEASQTINNNIAGFPAAVPAGTPVVRPPFTFRGATVDAGQPTPSAGFEAADVVGKRVTIKAEWTAADGAVRYYLQVAGDEDFGSFVHVYTFPVEDYYQMLVNIFGSPGAIPTAFSNQFVPGPFHHYCLRYDAVVEDMLITITGANISSGSAYGVPSMTAPFFAE